MNPHAAECEWIDAQADEMLRLVQTWCGVNSGTHNLQGLARMTDLVEAEFASLGGTSRRHDLPPAEIIDSHGQAIHLPLGQALHIVKRPHAPRRVLLCIHLDTVYEPANAFQHVTRLDVHTLRGPGVADAKGGLAVMLTALRAFERSGAAHDIGWEVILNPDEEIGSPGSAAMLVEAAARCSAGLVFEPALPDGSFVGARKGSGNFTAVIRGRAAHAGRDFAAGRNAIVAAAELIMRLHRCNEEMPGVTVNCGKVEGGGPLNIVPDLAIARFNVRAAERADQLAIENRIHELQAEIGAIDGVSIRIHGHFHSPPKPLDPGSSQLFDLARQSAAALNIPFSVHSSGGACDGNRLVAAGLPTIDTLGPRGGNLHSDREYLLIPSLTERAKLTLMLLRAIASHDGP